MHVNRKMFNKIFISQSNHEMKHRNVLIQNNHDMCIFLNYIYGYINEVCGILEYMF